MGGYEQNDNEPFNENMFYDCNRIGNSPWPLPREASCDCRYERDYREQFPPLQSTPVASAYFQPALRRLL